MKELTVTEPPSFEFYLDAWLYCTKAGLPATHIHKMGFKLYVVEEA